MKKIIHLSDTHIGDKGTDTRMNKVVNKIISLISDETPASDYVIVHTGDVIADAKNENYESALHYFMKLKNKGFTLLFVPGNHDYGTGYTKARKEYLKKFNEFRANFYEFQSYPVKTIIDDIAFIGLDSLEGRFLGLKDTDDISGINGEFGDSQLKGLSFILDSEDVINCKYKVVYLHYHPTDFKPAIGSKIEDSDKFKRILQGQKISALLFGHDHDKGNTNFNDSDEFKKCKEWEIERIYDGGSLLKKKYFLRIIDLSTPCSLDEKWISSDEEK